MVRKKVDAEKVKKQPVSFFPWQWGLITKLRGEWGETISGVVRRMMHEWESVHDIVTSLESLGDNVDDEVAAIYMGRICNIISGDSNDPPMP